MVPTLYLIFSLCMDPAHVWDRYGYNCNVVDPYQTLQFTYLWASIKDVQAIGEAFSPQKRTSSTEKDEIY